jgi:hypothetical protein
MPSHSRFTPAHSQFTNQEVLGLSQYPYLPALLYTFPVGISVLFTGCGSGNIGTVSGTVTLDAKPLAGAVVRFQPDAGQSPSSGITDESGQYSLRYTREIEGAEIGDHTVRITTQSLGNPDADPPRPPVPERVPAKYNSNSELKAKVEAGSNTINFPLEGEVLQTAR